jgi:hypothetical protein
VSSPRGGEPLLLRLLRGFGRFWWDFLVGDTPELFVGCLLVLGMIAILSLAARANALCVLLLPLLVVLLLVGTVARAIRSAGQR